MKFVIDNLYLFAIALASGGMLLWPLLRRGGGAAAVTPLEAVRLINHRNAIVIDVRDEAAFANGSLTGARNMPSASLESRIAELTRFKARPVVVICESGQQSSRALAALKAGGFDEAHSLAGGLAAWKQAGLPLVIASRDKPGNPSREGGRDRSKGGRREDGSRDGSRSDIRAGDRSKRGKESSRASSPLQPVPAGALNGRAVIDDAVPAGEAKSAEAPATPAIDRVKEAS